MKKDCECGHSMLEHRFCIGLPFPHRGFCEIEGCKCMHSVLSRSTNKEKVEK